VRPPSQQISQVWWYIPVNPVTQEAKVGGLWSGPASVGGGRERKGRERRKGPEFKSWYLKKKF
jgi:hypothetical protein